MTRTYKATDIHTDQTITSQDWEDVETAILEWNANAPADHLDNLRNANLLDEEPEVLENAYGLKIEYGPAEYFND